MNSQGSRFVHHTSPSRFTSAQPQHSKHPTQQHDFSIFIVIFCQTAHVLLSLVATRIPPHPCESDASQCHPDPISPFCNSLLQAYFRVFLHSSITSIYRSPPAASRRGPWSAAPHGLPQQGKQWRRGLEHHILPYALVPVRWRLRGCSCVLRAIFGWDWIFPIRA